MAVPVNVVPLCQAKEAVSTVYGITQGTLYTKGERKI